MKIIFFTLATVLSLLTATTAYPQKSLPIVVGIVIQQMRYDCLSRYGSTMGDGGFKRIITQGAYCNNAYYDYMLTEPAPGYATIYTGANPGSHGIIANQWYDRLSKKIYASVRDQKFSSVGTDNESGHASPLHLLGTTLGDEMKLSNFKQSKVISISWDDYSAVLPAGRLANGAYWFDDRTGNMVSSSYYMHDLPQWVKDFNKEKLCNRYLTRSWFTLKNASEYRASLPDNSIYENGIEGQNTFPYDIQKLSRDKQYRLLKYTPWSNDMVLDFALKAIEGEDLGKDEFTDLLMLNFAAPGYVSDIFGIRSMELQDVYIRLDNNIATLLTNLDQKFGKGNYLVFFTADRGSSDSPMFMADMGMEGKQINVQNSMVLLEAYLRALYGQDKWVDKYLDHQVYLNHVAIERAKLNISEVQDMASQFLVEIDGIDHAMPSSALTNSNSQSGIWKQAANSFNRKRSGDIIINLAPGWQDISGSSQQFSCSAQNSAYSHDTHVPLALYGRGINMITINRRVSIADITPTLATIMRILAPDYACGQAIQEAIRE